MSGKWWVRWLLTLPLIWNVGGAAGADKLVLSTSVAAPYTSAQRTGFLERLVEQVFRDAGVEAEVHVYQGASERSLLNANEGLDDGQALRVGGLQKLYPNLIQVPEPVMTNDFVALSTQSSFATPGWAALKPYQVSYIIGWKVFELNLPPEVARTPVREPAQMIALLEKQRADVMLYERWQGLMLARNAGLNIRVMEPPLASALMYMYLHKKHAALVPKVAQALAQFKRDGRYQRLMAETLRP